MMNFTILNKEKNLGQLGGILFSIKKHGTIYGQKRLCLIMECFLVENNT